MIDHVGLNVRDLASAKAFYELALAPLGYRIFMEWEKVVGFGIEASVPDLWIHERGEPTTTAHVSFRAGDRTVVDAFHRAALEAGGRDNGAPGLRPHYHEHYYGGFVLDPDGNNVEAVCHDTG
jgi:catechol 2,3-dioxygenase-like lactoylglutathione lyase family enzyme